MKHTKYKIGVVTNLLGPSMLELKQTADKYGVVFDQISFSAIPLENFRNSELVKKISSYDVVYYRTGMQGSVISELADFLSKKNIPCINCNRKHPFLHKKIQQALIADRYNIPQPKSFRMTNLSYESIVPVLGQIFIIKPDNGSKGNEVTLIKSATDLETFIKQKKKDSYLCQEYIADAMEYRVYVVGGNSVATYKKVRGAGDFRANLHVGGSMQNTEPHLEVKLARFSENIARKFSVDICGVDLLVKDGKIFFLELNLQPGWESLTKLTGANLCQITVQFILNQAHQNKPWFKRIFN